jgi:transcriptional regulator with XRE-family HTH domain
MSAGRVRVQVVATWTGRSADALRQAQRMTIEQFAAELGASVRTVSGWRQKPGTRPQAAIQEALDASLERASDRVKAQFAALVESTSTTGHVTGESALESVTPARLIPSPRPEFGDSAYLLSIRKYIGEIVDIDNRFGSAEVVPLSMRWFRTLHDQLGAGTYDTSLERDLQAAAGELAEVVGWLAYDAAQHDLCRRMNQERCTSPGWPGIRPLSS